MSEHLRALADFYGRRFITFVFGVEYGQAADLSAEQVEIVKLLQSAQANTAMLPSASFNAMLLLCNARDGDGWAVELLSRHQRGEYDESVLGRLALLCEIAFPLTLVEWQPGSQVFSSPSPLMLGGRVRALIDEVVARRDEDPRLARAVAGGIEAVSGREFHQQGAVSRLVSSVHHLALLRGSLLFSDYVVEVLERDSAFFSGEAATLSIFTVFDGAALSSEQLVTPIGILRQYHPLADLTAFYSDTPAQSDQSRLGFILEQQYEVRGVFDQDEMTTSYHRVERSDRALHDQQSLRLAFMFLGSLRHPGERVSTVRPLWGYQVAPGMGAMPMSHRAGENVGRGLLGLADETALVGRISMMYGVIDSAVALPRRRLIQARERADRIDLLVDAVLAWEGTFHGMGERAFKVALGIALLTEKDEESRRNTYKHAKSLYGLRSRIVHGSHDGVSGAKKGDSLEENAEECLRLGVLALRTLYEEGPQMLSQRLVNDALVEELVLGAGGARLSEDSLIE